MSGHNLYGNDIREFLETHSNSKERNAYILMERIIPKAHKNYLVTPGRPFALSDVTSELGIFGKRMAVLWIYIFFVRMNLHVY